MIYKICGESEWLQAEALEIYAGSADDERDGFIHFSTMEQLAGTASKHFAGQSGLVLLGVNEAKLGEALKWESARGGALFPHLYGALDVSNIEWVKPLPLDGEGKHIFWVGIY